MIALIKIVFKAFKQSFKYKVIETNSKIVKQSNIEITIKTLFNKIK